MNRAHSDGSTGGSDSTADERARLRHAMRTPLNHIIGYSELLLDEVRERGPEAMTTDLENIRAAGQELLALVNSMLDADSSTLGTRHPDSEHSEHPRSLHELAARQHSDDDTATFENAAIHGHILVVDDNPNNREIVTRQLEQNGFSVLTAENGAEALEAVNDHPVDLVLMDVMMPVMDGIEACKRLKKDADTRLIPVVIMTALGQLEHRVMGIKAGADDFLTKPVSRDELLARIQTSLKLKQTMDTKLDRLKGAQSFLSKFVPQSVLRQLEEHPEAPVLEKTDQDMSALFVDVTGYTKLSEEMRQTADFMVEKYFSRYFDAIHAHQGDVTETSGDGLMAVFPGSDPNEHAVNTVEAALAILRETEALNAQLAGLFEPISVHMGINSGIALIGPSKYEGASGARWTYTALGPAVNLAARIAGVATAGMICTGPETARRIQGRFSTAELGEKRLKNVRDAVMVYQVLTPTAARS